jgi:hypothetical protein
MAVTALVVAIIGAATGLGSLFWQFTTWKRSGWDLEVVAYWDSRRQEIIVEITNAGRQECVISEVRYFLEGTSDTPADFPDISLSDHDPLPASLAGSARAVLTQSIPNIGLGLPAAPAAASCTRLNTEQRWPSRTSGSWRSAIGDMRALTRMVAYRCREPVRRSAWRWRGRRAARQMRWLSQLPSQRVR